MGSAEKKINSKLIFIVIIIIVIAALLLLNNKTDGSASLNYDQSSDDGENRTGIDVMTDSTNEEIQNMHRECRLESCVLVPGDGEDMCLQSIECAGISGLTSKEDNTTGTSGTSSSAGTASGADPIPSITGDIAVSDILVAHGTVGEFVDVDVNAVFQNNGEDALAAIVHATITYDGIEEQTTDVWADLLPGQSESIYLGQKTLTPGTHAIKVIVDIDNFIDTNVQNNERTENFDVR